MKSESKAILALFCVTILWGLTFPLIKISSNEISSGLFVTFRLALSVIIFSPIIIKEKSINIARFFKIAIIFGSLEGSTYLFQTIGLQTINSSESAFVTTFSVVLIPFLSPLFGLDQLKKTGIIASLICLIGIFILSGANLNTIRIGYFWTLSCAALYALSVVYLSYEMRKFDKKNIKLDSTKLLVFLQILFGIPIPLASTFFDNSFIHFTPLVIGALLFCSTTTIFCYYIQTNFQKKVNMNKVAIIYAFEPIFATIFGRVLNSELITTHVIIGGALVLMSFIIVELF